MRPYGLLAVLLYSADVMAYLDPATGSMIIQGIIGAIAGAFVVIKLYWYQFKRWFDRMTGKGEPAPTEPNAMAEAETAPAEKE